MDKKCLKCKQIKDINNFYKYKSGYLASHCKQCNAERNKEWRKTKNGIISTKRSLKKYISNPKIKEKIIYKK